MYTAHANFGYDTTNSQMRDGRGKSLRVHVSYISVGKELGVLCAIRMEYICQYRKS